MQTRLLTQRRSSFVAVEMDVVVGLGAEGARRTNRHCEFAETLLVRRRQQTALLGRPCCGDRQDRNENQLSHVGTPFCLSPCIVSHAPALPR